MDAIARVAEIQFGLITREQPRAARLSDSAIDRRLERGTWVRLFPGVYRIAGAPVTDLQRLRAATLWGGPVAIASHQSALAQLRLAEIRSADAHSDRLRRRSGRGGARSRVRDALVASAAASRRTAAGSRGSAIGGGCRGS